MSTDRMTSPFGDPFGDKGKDPMTDAAQTLPTGGDRKRR